jgi:hypothetical protein
MIKLTPSQWATIRADLETKWPRSVFLIRTTMKRELGFTFRKHTENLYRIDGSPTEFRRDTICLDFFNEAAESWFHLTYFDYYGK